MKIENLNAMPAPTWSWLKMNSTSLEIDPELAPAGAAAVDVAGAAPAGATTATLRPP